MPTDVVGSALRAYWATYRDREELEQQILVQERVLCDLRSRLNKLTPIARLPPDILAEVFLVRVAQCAAAAPDAADADLSWLRLLLVCTHWRHVAISTPALWTRVVVGPRAQWLQLQLLRAHEMPLMVLAVFTQGARPEEEDAKLLNLECIIQNELARVRVLHLRAPVQIVRQAFMAIAIAHSAAHLTEFKIEYVAQEASIGDDRPILPFLLPDNMPTLQKLVLVEIPFMWMSLPSFVNLRHLEIRKDVRDGHLVMADFLNAVESLNLLEFLSLRFNISCYAQGTVLAMWQVPHTRVIILPYLRNLMLQASCADCSVLLNHMVFSRSPNISCVCLTDRGSEDFAAAIAAKLIYELVPLNTISLQSGLITRLLVFQGDAPLPQLPSNPIRALSGSAQLDLSLCMEGMPNSHMLWMALICRALPLAYLRRLEISSPQGCFGEVEWWLKVFGTMDEVTTLRICGPSCGVLPQMLRVPVHGRDDQPFMLPRLERLEVDLPPVPRELVDATIGRYASDLRASLTDRRALGMGLGQLAVLQRASSQVESDQHVFMQLLQPVVPTIFETDNSGALICVST